MLGWKLFVRAITLLIENLGDALRVSLIPYGVVIVLSAWVASGKPELPADMTYEEILASGAVGGSDFLVMLFNLFASLWIAVLWHRYVLLNEKPSGWFPTLRGGEMLGYLGRMVLIVLIIFAVTFAVSFPIGALSVAIPGLSVLILPVAAFVGMIVFYRLGVILPAGAIGHPITLGKAVEATRGHSGTVVILALLTAGFPLLMQLPTLLEGNVGVISTVYQGVVGWIGLMVGVSALTSLYGHLVEGRPVD